MDNDYPASHSMDTCFFAIDHDGHVAYFESGEAGAVPVNALTGPTDAVQRQLLALPLVEVVYDRKGGSLPGSTNASCGHAGLRGTEYPILMFLASLDPVRDDLNAGRAVEVAASEGVAVLFRELPPERAKTLHDRGVCLGCEWHDYTEQESEDRLVDWATRGLFCYGHLTENWISGPYGRERRPAQPIHIDQLPPDLRDAIKALRFDEFCFAATPHIQPVEHATCESWEAAFVDAAYTTIRPMPGKEADYAGAYEFYAQNIRDLRVEPPPGQTPDSAGE